MTDAVEARYPRVARILKQMISEELENRDDAENEATVLLRFPTTHSDAVIEATVVIKGDQWREPVLRATMDTDLDRLRASLRSWLAGIEAQGGDLGRNGEQE